MLENSLSFRCKQLTNFIDDLPKSFEKLITRKVVILKKDKESIRIGDVVVYNAEAIYVRNMFLVSLRQINLEQFLNYELSLNPTALFHDNDNIREPKEPHILVIDGNTVFWATE